MVQVCAQNIHLQKVLLFQLVTELVEIFHRCDVQQVSQIVVAQSVSSLSASCTPPRTVVIDPRRVYDQGVNYEDISNVVWGTTVEGARTRAHQLFCEIHGCVSGGMISDVEARGRKRELRFDGGCDLR